MDHSISVIIPTYQHAATISACLESIFAQTLKPFEVIVVNDGSTDNTLDVLKLFGERIILLDQPNQGGNAARNNGFAASHGDFVIFCDADINMRPDMLEKLSAALVSHPESAYAYSGFRFGWKSFSSFPFDADRLRRMNFIHTTSLIRRAAFPGFDPQIRRFQDWDVWLTMLERQSTGAFVAEELFRVDDGHGRKGISQWRPSFFFRIPWTKFGIIPPSVRRYNEARQVIATKHHLNHSTTQSLNDSV